MKMRRNEKRAGSFTLTLSRDETQLLVDAFLVGYASGWEPDGNRQKNAWGMAAVTLKDGMRSRRFPVALEFDEDGMGALLDIVNNIAGSCGGPEEVFGAAFVRDSKLRAMWRRMDKQLFQAFGAQYRKDWQ